MPPYIGISGYYGYGNLGDEALLAGLLNHLPRDNCLVFSADPAATQRLHGVRSAHRYRELWQLARCRALISGGGGLLQDATSSRSLSYYLGVIRLAKGLGKKVVIYGQSIGPLSPGGKVRVKRALQGVPLAVRDRASQALLSELGLASELFADAALLLRKEVSPAAPNPPVLLIPRGGSGELTMQFAALARTLIKEGKAVCALALHPEQDREAVFELARSVDGLTTLCPNTPQAALQAVAASSHVVSVRLHGLILAALAEKPLTGFAYDPKVAGFLETLGSAPLGVNASANDILAALQPRTVDPLFAQAHQRPSMSAAPLINRAEAGAAWLNAVLEPIP